MPERQGLNHSVTLGVAVIIFCVIVFFLLVIKEYFNIDDLNLNPFAAVLLIGVIGAVSLSISYGIGHEVRSWKEAGDEIVKKFIKMEEKNTGSSNIKILGDANYYGGHKKYAQFTILELQQRSN